MKKTFFILSAMLLFFGAAFAQLMEVRSVEIGTPSVPAFYNPSNSSRAVIYSEGFEGTTGTALPDGWTTAQSGAVTPWVTINSTTALGGVNNPVEAHSGDRSMARGWQEAGRDAWAFTKGFTLTEGVGYDITFWFIAAGFPAFDEYDDFEVRIGQTPTSAAMSGAHLLFENIKTRVNRWTLAECYILAPVTGTYYLGFHDLNVGAEGIFIYLDDIEVAECTCCPISNLTANYLSDCKAELKWEAPIGDFTYKVFRDNEEIATVNTESYIDDDLEATLSHTWAVRVVCQDGLSLAIRVTKERCENPDCEHLAKYLSVNYDDDCEHAELNWHAPTEELWDNTAGVTMYISESVRWMYATFQRDIMADDFIVPAGETWTISEVVFSGSHSSNSGDYEPPHAFGIEIYKDNDNRPGTLLYEKTDFLPLDGNMSSAAKTLILPEPYTISSPGKYWISFYGVYNDIDLPENQYFLFYCDQPNEAPLCFLTESNGPEWEPTPSSDFPSIYFRLFGTKSQDVVKYNVYRDGTPIATGVTETTFFDEDFNPYSKHKWSVKVVCPGGSGVSAPVLIGKDACDEESVIENSGISFTIFPNPTPGNLTIKSENNFSKVEIFNFLGQTVITQLATNNTTSLNVSQLNAGIYFVRITTEHGVGVQKFVKQ